MTQPDPDQIKAFIVAALQQELAAAGFAVSVIPDDFDLRDRGVIDSLGFVQLLGNLETQFGGPIDLAGLPPEQLTIVGALSGHIASQLVGRHT